MNPIQTSSRPILLPEPLDTHYRQSDAERLPPRQPETTTDKDTP